MFFVFSEGKVDSKSDQDSTELSIVCCSGMFLHQKKVDKVHNLVDGIHMKRAMSTCTSVCVHCFGPREVGNGVSLRTFSPAGHMCHMRNHPTGCYSS